VLIGSTVKVVFGGTLTKEESNSANNVGLNSSQKPNSLTGPALCGRAFLRPINILTLMGQTSMLPRWGQFDDSAVCSFTRCSFMKSHYSVTRCTKSKASESDASPLVVNSNSAYRTSDDGRVTRYSPPCRDARLAYSMYGQVIRLSEVLGEFWGFCFIFIQVREKKS